MDVWEVTKSFEFLNPDDELLSVTKCKCGHSFTAWEFTISIYPESPTECPNCKRKLYFTKVVKVFEVLSND